MSAMPQHNPVKMEVNEQNLAALSQYLRQTLDPETQKQAEQFLVSVEGQINYPLLVLKLVTDEKTEPTLRFAAALLFKNYVKRNWALSEDEEPVQDKISPQDRDAIKAQLVDLMIAVPEKIQLQLSEALTIIADHDFPRKWENLLRQLISKFSTNDYKVNNGVLQTAHSIFKRWRHQFRSDELFTEIKFVLEQFSAPYLQLFQTTDALVAQMANNAAALAVLAQSLTLLIKIYYDLNCQDLPEFFEDNLPMFMNLLYKYLTYTNPLLTNDDGDEAGPLEKIKAGICEIVELYTQRYEDAFTMLPQFVQTIWSLLTTTGSQPKYDILVSKAMSFLTSVVRIERHKELFQSDDTLKQFCEKIVLPNMTLRESDEELFEDDPIEYIRRDLEGSDSDTRRRAAGDFIRGLLEQFESQITGIVSNYIQHYLQRYNSNPTANWKDKDTAIFLLTSIATRNVTQQMGATRTNALIDIVDFFSKNVVQDLQTPVNGGAHPILKVDAIKYLHTFRNQLNKEQLVTVFPLLVNHLPASNYVVYTYAAITIERILFLRQGKIMLFGQPDIRPFSETLLTNLFNLIERGTTPEKLAENDYLMKTVMRVIITSRQDMAPYVNIIMAKLVNILGIISKNPSNPRFNHYVFESVGALIRFNCPNNPVAVSAFEEMLFVPFQTILSTDVQEFTPYVFQLLSQLLEFHSEGGLLGFYQALLPPMLQPQLWDQHGNIPALVRLLQAYLSKGAASIVANNQLEPILGISQKLMASRLHDYMSFTLLDGVVQHVPTEVLSRYLRSIFTLILTRLMTKMDKDTNQPRFDKFTRSFLYFICLFMAIDKPNGGPEVVVQAIESVQPSLFGQLLGMFVVPELQKVPDNIDRKVCAVGLVRLLTQSPTFVSGSYVAMWPNVATALVKLFEAPTDLTQNDDDELYTFDLEESGYQASFSRLATASQVKIDPTASIADPRAYFAQSLMALSQSRPGLIPSLLQAVPEEIRAFINGYLQAAGVARDVLTM
ncbi:Cse1-domain-containing protein [Jimgerdemannia flammicorona]|uniref:Cse1-domain-containing protein n=1 Tax=Jimgerdemannia flammicorona TaxID=994334 RepID=A0A433DCX8_9FUNG|nr:Cse1-domain-containing protein [Jimgerdemannia flammicorona]